MTLILTAPQPKAPPYIDVTTAIRTGYTVKTMPLYYDPLSKQGYSYWTDGKKVYWCNFPISSDVENFVFYNSDFARDSKHCYVREKSSPGLIMLPLRC